MSALVAQANDCVDRANAAELAAILDHIQKIVRQRSEMPYVASPQIKKRAKSSSSKTKVAIPDLPVRAAKRPLNSWMAFRSYYSPIFTSCQQKDISGFLTSMWQADPFKAKWAILAKAYSTIRDEVGKPQAPLDKFLQISAPLIGIIEPDKYLDMLSWKETVEFGFRRLVRGTPPNVTSSPARILTSTLSAEDVVDHCRQVGYIQQDVVKSMPASSLTMATQPSFTSTPKSDTAAPNTVFVSGSDNIITADPPMVPFWSDGNPLAMTLDSQLPIAQSTEAEEFMPALGLHENAFLLDASGDMYPFNDQFNPDDVFGLHYDPQAGDNFNSFNGSEWASIEAFLASDNLS